MANPNWTKGIPSPNPKGRPTKARELAYLAVITEEVTLQDWRAIIAKAKRDARGIRILDTPEGPKIEDDPNSDGSTREKGRRFLADYIIGKLNQPISFDGDLADILDGLDATDITRIISEAGSIISGDTEAGGQADPGAGAQTNDRRSGVAGAVSQP